MKLNIDLSNDAPLTEFGTLPEGEYLAMIVACEQRATKAGDGHYLNIELDVLDGEFKGRKVWDVINLWNANAKAVEIARRTLRSIADAIGHGPRVEDTDALLNKPLVIKVSVEQQAGFKDRNRIVAYKSANAEAVAAKPVVKPQQTAPASNKPAWMQKAA